jgi:hypothetical protein
LGRPVKVSGEIPDAFFRPFPLGDVLHHGHEVIHRAVRPAHAAAGNMGIKQGAILADKALVERITINTTTHDPFKLLYFSGNVV